MLLRAPMAMGMDAILLLPITSTLQNPAACDVVRHGVRYLVAWCLHRDSGGQSAGPGAESGMTSCQEPSCRLFRNAYPGSVVMCYSFVTRHRHISLDPWQGFDW